MLIIGDGLIARSLRSIEADHDGTVAFASGVSDSTSTDPAAYERERSLLQETIDTAARDRRRLLYFSSGGAVYGRWTGAASEATSLRPETDYGRHKVACERKIIDSGVRHLILRLPNVVGDTGNPNQLLPSLVRQALEGSVRVYVLAARDLVDAGDLAEIVDELIDRVPSSAIVNLATGRSTAAEDIARRVCSILHSEAVIERIEAGRPEVFDPSLLRSLLGRDPFEAEGYAEAVLGRHVPTLARRLRPPGDPPAA
jgi:nucleoside-diphosphate-sugar epimerase